MSDDDLPFADFVLSRTGGPAPRLPHAYYDADGDCAELTLRDEDYKSERVDSLLTVHYGRDSQQIVGATIKGIRRWLLQRPQIQIILKDETQTRVNLAYLLVAGAAARWEREFSGDQVTYEKTLQLSSPAVPGEAEEVFDVYRRVIHELVEKGDPELDLVPA